MADALDVDPMVVVTAMAKTIGLPVGDDGMSDLARMLPPSAKNLTVEQRDAIVRLVRAVAPTTGGQRAVPTTQTPTPRAPRKAQKGKEVPPAGRPGVGKTDPGAELDAAFDEPDDESGASGHRS